LPGSAAIAAGAGTVLCRNVFECTIARIIDLTDHPSSTKRRAR
jgi:hypothetical protein